MEPARFMNRSGRSLRTKLAMLLALCGAWTASPAGEKGDRQAAIKALMETSDAMSDIPFREVVLAASGHEVLAVDRTTAADQALLDHLAAAGNALIKWMNGPENPAKNLRRINEVSRLVEDKLHLLLHQGDFTCRIPTTVKGKAQRSGYPDLMITHVPSGRVTYLDPKLYEATSKTSSLRTFYYEPNALTGKVQHAARHVLLGIFHDGKDGAWTFQGWNLMDLFDFRVRLKAEFQGSNKDLYREKLLLRSSAQ